MTRTVLVIGIVLVLALGGVYIALLPTVEAPTREEHVGDTVQISLAIEAAYPLAPTTVHVGSSALAALQEVGAYTPFTVRTKEFAGLGVLVEQVGSLVNGTDGKYWHYYVNGELAPVGATEYIVQAGDVIEWRFAEPDTDY